MSGKQNITSINFIQQFGSLIDDAFLTIDGDLTIKEINGACIRLLGENLIGSSLRDKLIYNNLDRYLSVRQTEVKRDLTLAGKQEG